MRQRRAFTPISIFPRQGEEALVRGGLRIRKAAVYQVQPPVSRARQRQIVGGDYHG